MHRNWWVKCSVSWFFSLNIKLFAWLVVCNISKWLKQGSRQLHVNILTLTELKSPPLKIFEKNQIAGEGDPVTDTKKTPIIFSPTRCLFCPWLLTLQQSCQQDSKKKQKKKPLSFVQSHSLVHNRLYSPIALGGLEVPLCKEWHREVASIQTYLGEHCASSCFGCRSGSIKSPFCCLALKTVEGCLSQAQEL